MNCTKIILLLILEASVCFIISPAFSLGHISGCGKMRIVFSFSLPHFSRPPLFLFAPSSPHSCSHACALTCAVTRLLFPSHMFLLSLSLLLIFTSLLSPFSYLTLSEFPHYEIFVVSCGNETQIIHLQSVLEVSEPKK